LNTVLAATAASWGVVMALSPLLQIRAMRKHRSSKEVSIGYLQVLFVGFLLWLSYGAAISNLAIMVPNSVAAVVCAITIVVARHYRR
jgi:MtN3 and saliva related transmembrane protein